MMMKMRAKIVTYPGPVFVAFAAGALFLCSVAATATNDSEKFACDKKAVGRQKLGSLCCVSRVECDPKCQTAAN